MSVYGDAEQEVVSHPFPPALPLVCAASVLPFNQCQLRPTNCTIGLPAVLNLCFWFRPGIGQSLGIKPVTDVPPDRAARVLSACQELEKVACLYHATFYITYNLLRAINCTSASPRLPASVIICHRLRSACQESDSNCKQNRDVYLLPSERLCFNCQRSTELPETLRT